MRLEVTVSTSLFSFKDSNGPVTGQQFVCSNKGHQTQQEWTMKTGMYDGSFLKHIFYKRVQTETIIENSKS